jgi:hypothetical protein
MARGIKFRLETRLNRGDAQRGKAKPDLWKGSSDGEAVTDARVAKLRLGGARITDITRKTGLGAMPVHFRLRRMGFPPGWPCVYYHGEPATGLQLQLLCSDFGKSRRQIAALFDKSYGSVKKYLGPQHLHKPLPAVLAHQVLSVIGVLRREHRKGTRGRPTLLLPSEKQELPAKYDGLKGDLKLLHRFLKDEGGRAAMADVWNWLCELRRQGKIRALFFWPQFFRWIGNSYNEAAFLRTAWIPAELAIDFLSEEYEASAETIRRLVRSTS